MNNSIIYAICYEKKESTISLKPFDTQPDPNLSLPAIYSTLVASQGNI